MKDIKEIINFEKNTINKTNTYEYKDLVQYNRELLDNDGCCVLPNFIKEDSIKRMKQRKILKEKTCRCKRTAIYYL